MSYVSLQSKILLAMHKLEQRGDDVVSAEVLSVAAWKEHPQEFGLRGFTREHPDFHRIYSALCGRRGLIGLGFLTLAGEKMVSMTKHGRERAEQLLNRNVPEAHPRLSERDVAVISRAMRSRAWDKYGARKEDIVFGDALDFWGCARRQKVSGESVPAQIDAMAEVLQHAESKLGERDKMLADVRVLMHLHRWLQGRYSTRLKGMAG